MLDLNQEGQPAPQPPLVKTSPTLAPEPIAVPASLVASTFVEQYYRTLGNAPHQLHRFYSHDSIFARLEPGDALSMDAESKLTVMGQVAIHAKLRDQGYKNCKALIDTIDFQDSIDGSVIVLITGYISNNGTKPRPFTQSILLARQERGGYYVRNDILRFVQRSLEKNVPAPAPETAQPGFVAETKTPSVASDNAASDVCSEGPKESISDTMEHVEEPDLTSQPEPAIEQEMKVDETEPEQVSAEPAPALEPIAAPAVPSKPASWAALFTKSAPAPPAPSTTAPHAQTILTSSTQSAHTLSESAAKTPDYSNHIFIQNLPESSTESEIMSLFSAYGTVDSVDILPKRTIAFVIFENAQGAQEALKAKTIMLQGRELQVSARKPRAQYGNRGRGRGGRGRHVRGRNNKPEERQ